MSRAGGVLTAALALATCPPARAAEASPQMTIDYVTGGIMSVHSETRVDLDAGVVSFGSAPLGPDPQITTYDQRPVAAGDIATLRRIVGALEPDEIDRDTCPLPRDPRTGMRSPKPPIADAMHSLVVGVAGRRMGGNIPVNACPTKRVEQLVALVQRLSRPAP